MTPAELPYTYKAKVHVLTPQCDGWFCPACGEGVLDVTQFAPCQRPDARVQQAGQRARSSTRNSSAASVRGFVNLDQREAGELFGGGVNAFSRYETGKTKPPLALVKLFKVLERHPDLLDEVRAA